MQAETRQKQALAYAADDPEEASPRLALSYAQNTPSGNGAESRPIMPWSNELEDLLPYKRTEGTREKTTDSPPNDVSCPAPQSTDQEPDP